MNYKSHLLSNLSRLMSYEDSVCRRMALKIRDSLGDRRIDADDAVYNLVDKAVFCISSGYDIYAREALISAYRHLEPKEGLVQTSV